MAVPVVALESSDGSAAAEMVGRRGRFRVDQCGPRQRRRVGALEDGFVKGDAAELGFVQAALDSGEIQGNSFTLAGSVDLREGAACYQGEAALLDLQADTPVAEALVEGAELEHPRGPLVDHFCTKKQNKLAQTSERGRGGSLSEASGGLVF